VHREDRCLGCRYCEMACPFDVPRFDPALGIVGKCHLCHHRLDAGLLPACVAACPTEALRLREPGEAAASATEVPGFADPSHCRPNVRFLTPRQGHRATLFHALAKILRGRMAVGRSGRGTSDG
jgi:formate dehydrogenase iron-sulfur subunit